MKTYFKFLSNIALLTLTVLSLSSCDNLEPEFICEKDGEITLKAEPYVKAIAEDNVTAEHNDSFIVSIPGSNLMSVKVDYPYISVSSIFSNVSQKPRIAYLGNFSSIDEIPLRQSAWQGYTFDTQAEIHDGGGYVATLATYDPFQREDKLWIVAMWFRERSTTSELRIVYKVYSRNDLLTFSK